jgi:hypothetical protein
MRDEYTSTTTWWATVQLVQTRSLGSGAANTSKWSCWLDIKTWVGVCVFRGMKKGVCVKERSRLRLRS